MVRYLVLSVFSLIFVSCLWEVKPLHYQSIALQNETDSSIVHKTAPYRIKMERELEKFVCNNPVELQKTDSLLACWMAKALLTAADSLESVPSTAITLLLINKGGIRSGLPKDSLRIRHFFNLMPFDNVLCIALFAPEHCSQLIHDLPSKMFYLMGFVRYQNHYIPIPLNHQRPFEVPVRLVTSDFIFNGGDGFKEKTRALSSKISGYRIRDCLILQAQKDHTLHQALGIF